MQRQPIPDLGRDSGTRPRPRRKFFDIERAGAVEDDQVHHLMGGLEQVLQHGKSHVTELAFLRGEGSELPQPSADRVGPATGSVEPTPFDEFGEIPVHGGRRDVRRADDGAQRLLGPVLTERLENRQRSGQ